MNPYTVSLKRRIKRIQRKYGIDDSQIPAKVAEHQEEVKALAAQIRNKVKAQKVKFPQWAILCMFAHVPEHPAPTSHILHPRFHNLHVHRKNTEENVFFGGE